MKKALIILIAISVLFVGCKKPEVPNGITPLIPKEDLYSYINTIPPKLSHDGQMIAWVSSFGTGILNVYISKVSNPYEYKQVSFEKENSVRYFDWNYMGNIFYYVDNKGDENYHVMSVNLKDGKTKNLTPGDKVNAWVYAMSPKKPETVIIKSNSRNPSYFDLYSYNLLDGKMEPLIVNKEWSSFVFDNELNLRFACKFNKDSAKEYYKFQDGGFILYDTIPPEDSNRTTIFAFDNSGQFLYMADSRNRDTTALYEVDTKTGKKKMLAKDDKSDLSGYFTSEVTEKIIAASFYYDRVSWQVLDDSFKNDFEIMSKADDGDLELYDNSLDDNIWLFYFDFDTRPIAYYIYNRDKKEVKPLFDFSDYRKKLELAKMRSVTIKSRDGLDLLCYLSLPPWTDSNDDGRPFKPISLILKVHGGPWARDYWCYDYEHQLLANRGYAVLSVNFRGSVGFGKSFLNAGFGQWGRKMQDDLIDAVDWAIKEGIAQPEKIAIMGASYGGYAALSGLAFTPDKFACGIDVCGIANMQAFIDSSPPYWKPTMIASIKKIGADPSTEEGKKFLAERSPINYAKNIIKPLLIGHGENDVRVMVSESESIVKVLKEREIPVVYCFFPDEGHGIKAPKNNLAFSAIMEAFLSQILGGRMEILSADDFKGSSIQIKEGIDYINGLKQTISNN